MSDPITSLGADILADMHSSKGDPRDLLPQQISRVREHLNANLYDFAYLIGGATRIREDPHLRVCRYYQQWAQGNPGWKRMMFQLPRGSYKSTLITINGSLWLICNDPDRTVVVFNEKLDNAKMFVGAIEEIVRRSVLFQIIYRDLLPPGVARDDTRTTPKTWPFGSEKLLFQRGAVAQPEVSTMAYGVGAASAGHHWSHIVMDDLISEEARDSPSAMQRAKDWLDTSVYLGYSPEQLNALIACTRWHYDDVYEYARKEHSYRLYRRSALEDGNSIMPDLWTVEHLVDFQEKHPYTFSSQMQNRPMAGKSQSFQAQWRREGTVEQQPNNEPAFVIRADHYDPDIQMLDALYAGEWEWEEKPPQSYRST